MLQAYIIGTVWACYQYLVLRNALSICIELRPMNGQSDVVSSDR
jgi:hypothetical protein